MKHTFETLSVAEKNKVLALMRKDCRVVELYKTMKVRPLNVLETLMLNQITAEYCNGVA